MQWLVEWFFPNRIVFYWGMFHPQQLREGADYRTLRPTIAGGTSISRGLWWFEG